MLKLFSLLVVTGATTVAGLDSVQACGCGAGGAAAVPAAAATASAPRSPATVAQNGRQSSRRYSAVPGGDNRAPAMMMRGGRSSGGSSWSASRKVLGY